MFALKKKAFDFMQAHPKATAAALDTFTAVAGGTGLGILANGGIVASADETTTSTVADTLVTQATSAWSDATSKVVPFIGAVMGFNIVVRLVRRFAKG